MEDDYEIEIEFFDDVDYEEGTHPRELEEDTTITNDNSIGFVESLEAGVDIDFIDSNGRSALFYAVIINKNEIVQTIIEAGTDVNITDDEGKTPLFYCNEEKMVSSLINAGAVINITDNQGKTALMNAIENNNESLASTLIDVGADVKVVDKSGRNALFHASMNGNEMLVSQLLKSTDSNCTDSQGKTALMYAVQNNQASVAAKLIEAGADLNVTDKDGRTALIYISLAAIDVGSREYIMYFYQFQSNTLQSPKMFLKDTKSMAKMLMKGGANLNIADNQGKTALMYSLQDNKLILTDGLINAGANVNVTDDEGRTALFYSISCNSERVVQSLINAGADVNIIDVEGRSALIHLAQESMNRINNKSHVVASKLIRNDAEINITDNKGKTALMYALQNNNEKLAYTLIDSGADVKTVDESGKTALFYVLSNGNGSVAHIEFRAWSINFGTIYESDEEASLTYKKNIFQESRESIAIKLIEAGADFNIVYNEGKTPLIYSVENGFERLARALIDAGANVNVADNQGKTALIYYAQKHNESMVSLLIEAGADVNVVDHVGCTALFYGIGNETIVRCLIDNGKVLINKRDKFNRSPLFYAFTESLTTARYLLDRGCTLRRQDHTSIMSFFIEYCMRKIGNHSNMADGLKLLQEKGIHQETIYEALIDSVFCRILFATKMESQKSFSQRMKIKQIIKQVTQVLTLAKMYIAEDDGQKVEIIENIELTVKETSNLCIKIPAIVDLLEELGTNPSYTDSDGNTPLHYATCLPLTGLSLEKVTKICQQLNDLGTSGHEKNYRNETPLLFCLSNRDWVTESLKSSKVKLLVEVCRFLLEQGSSAEETTKNGKSIFHLIIELFQEGLLLSNARVRKTVLEECLELLRLFTSFRVTKEVTVNRRDGISGNSPLHLWATLEFNPPSEKHSGAVDPNAFEKQIVTKIFEHLFACGSKLNGRNGFDQTPLHLCKTWTAAKLLIDAGAKTDVVDSEGSSPLLVAVKGSLFFKAYSARLYPELQQPNDFWKTLIENKLNPWIINNLGNSIMSILVESEAFVLAKALLDVVCRRNDLQNDATAVSLLNSICRDQSTHAQWKSILVGIILKSRKNLINPTHGEDTPLHFCCRNIVRERSRFLSSVDTFGSDVIASVHWRIVRQLLSHGFRNHCHDPDKSGKSCIDIASKCPLLKDLLTKPLNINEVPLVIPWISTSKSHKHALAKVARGQEYRQIPSFWYHQNYIQKGSFGLVFVGINENDGREVAIKRTEKLRTHRPEDKREITSLTKLADCEQVVRYLSFFEDQDFSYIVLELMEGNLNDYLDGKFDVKKSVQLCADVVKGLKYLHELSIVHRDLKPSNILFKTVPMLGLKISDFGLSRCIEKCSTSATVYGSVAGTRCWIAPEVLTSSYKEHSMASDVFSCGLLLHYILKVKTHPFSPTSRANKSDLQIHNETESNILKDNVEGWESSLCPEATDLIKRMINRDKEKRPTAVEALAHPLFWSKKRKTIFLIAIGNQPEIKIPRAKVTSPLTGFETELENNFSSIVKKKTWDDSGYSNMPVIYAEMTRKRKPYDTSSIVELVRFIRNAYAHVSEDTRPTSVRKLVIEDFVFLEHFPSLVLEVFKCVKGHGWDTSREEVKYALDDATT